MLTRRMRRLLLLVVIILGVWLTFGALMIWKQLAEAGSHPDPLRLVANVVIQVLSWATVTPLAIYAVRALALPGGVARRLGGIALLLALAPAAVVMQEAVETAFTPAFARAFRQVGGRRLFVIVYSNVFPLLGIGAATWCAAGLRTNEEQRRNAAELVTETSRIQLQQLQAQLEPHFLFNTLNCVAALINQDARRAEITLGQLSELLDRSLCWQGETEITLEDELSFVSRYLEIQTLRFRDTLESSVDSPPLLGRALVPPLILQPLVENAIVHGVLRRSGRGSVSVHAEVRDEQVLLEVRDTGPGFPAGREPERGIGISNTSARLKLLYGDRQSLTFRHSGGRFVARVELPVKWAPAS